MKLTKKFKFQIILGLLAGLLLCVQPTAWAEPCPPPPPPPECRCFPGFTCKCGRSEDVVHCGGLGSQSCNDPAFIATVVISGTERACQKPNASLDPATSPWNADQPMPQKSEKIIAAETAKYQAFQDAVKKNPENVFSETLSLWKSNISTDVQKMAIVHSLGATKKKDEIDSLQFMLQALDAPDAKRKECAQLAKGKRKDRELAAQRLALLESNPRLQRKCNCACR